MKKWTGRGIKEQPKMFDVIKRLGIHSSTPFATRGFGTATSEASPDTTDGAISDNCKKHFGLRVLVDEVVAHVDYAPVVIPRFDKA